MGLEILTIIMASATILLLLIVFAILFLVFKILKIVRRISETAQDGTKTAFEVIEDVRTKIIGPATLSAIATSLLSKYLKKKK
jgi:uncharacterized membrane protein HdeD (DUF308 family)